jgi:hypothetical protein
MAREMVWVKRIEGWGCSDCAWVFVPSGPPVGKSMDEMMGNFVARREKEFVSHDCTKHPRTQIPSKNKLRISDEKVLTHGVPPPGKSSTK